VQLLCACLSADESVRASIQNTKLATYSRLLYVIKFHCIFEHLPSSRDKQSQAFDSKKLSPRKRKLGVHLHEEEKVRKNIQKNRKIIVKYIFREAETVVGKMVF